MFTPSFALTFDPFSQQCQLIWGSCSLRNVCCPVFGDRRVSTILWFAFSVTILLQNRSMLRKLGNVNMPVDVIMFLRNRDCTQSSCFCSCACVSAFLQSLSMC